MIRKYSVTGMTYAWAGDRLGGYRRGSVAAVVSGIRRASRDMMERIDNLTGWKITDQVRDLDSHGRRLYVVLEALYRAEEHPPVAGTYQCPACGVFVIGGGSCWNCGDSSKN